MTTTETVNDERNNVSDYTSKIKGETKIFRSYEVPVDHWLNLPPVPLRDEDGLLISDGFVEWLKGRDELAAYSMEKARKEKFEQVQRYRAEEIAQKIKNSAIRLGEEWKSALLLKLEAGGDLVDTYTRVLTGCHRDNNNGIATAAADGYDGEDGEYDNLEYKTQRGEPEHYMLTTYTDDNQFGYWNVEAYLRSTFLERASKVMGEETARKTWERISSESEEAAWGDGAPRWTEYRATRLGSNNYPRPVTLVDPVKTRSIGLAALDATVSPEPLIEGLINADSVTYLVGEFGTYKTFTLIAWGMAVASGLTWCGHQAAAAVPVIYVAAEGHHGLRERFAAARGGNAFPATDNMHIYTEALNLGDRSSVDELKAEIARVGAKLVILDTLHKVTAGIDTMGDGGAGIVSAALEDIKSAGTTIVIAHHTGYAGQHARGSSALEDDADMVWLIQKKGGQGGTPVTRELSQRKNRDGAEASSKSLVFNPLGKSGYVSLDVPDERLSVDDLIDLLDDADLPDGASNRACEQAAKDAGVKYSRGDLRAAVTARQERIE